MGAKQDWLLTANAIISSLRNQQAQPVDLKCTMERTFAALHRVFARARANVWAKIVVWRAGKRPPTATALGHLDAPIQIEADSPTQ
jgi:hypothetical protein